MESMDPLDGIVISTITEAEFRYGLLKKPGVTKLHIAVEAFLTKANVMPWDSNAAKAYASLRLTMTAGGKALSALDMMIAAHAISLNALLVTSDKGFQHAAGLSTVNWAIDL